MSRSPRIPLGECKFVVGEWYYNPMMARCGDERGLYTRVSSITNRGYFWHIHFDEFIDSKYNHITIDDPIGQSNESYEDEMEHIKFENIKRHLASRKYGL